MHVIRPHNTLTVIVHVRLHIHNYIDNIQILLHTNHNYPPLHGIKHPLIPIDLYRIDLHLHGICQGLVHQRLRYAIV